MLKMYGKIIKVDSTKRVITIQQSKQQRQLYIQRAMFNQFFNFFHPGNTIVVSVKKSLQPLKHERQYSVKDVLRIVKKTQRKSQVLYSYNAILTQTKDFINSLKTKMFLDLEMSMHPYHQDKFFTQEIIQAGYVLIDDTGKIIETYKAFIQPSKHKKLTKRTLKFLDLTQEDVDQGIPYDAFHDKFNTIVKTHNPAIVVWGKNDALALKETSDINDLPGLEDKSRFVNLLQLHKNVFKLRNDLGLLNAFKLYGYESDNQRHDALEDAVMTAKIFEGFKKHLNNELKLDLTQFHLKL